jgi:hypothetical protein
MQTLPQGGLLNTLTAILPIIGDNSRPHTAPKQPFFNGLNAISGMAGFGGLRTGRFRVSERA